MTNEKIFESVEKLMPAMKEVWEFMEHNPETGFHEWKANDFLAEKYRALGYDLKMAGNVPGFYTDIDTGKPGPKVLILGELDALPVPGHPDADPLTNAAHACGHNCQSAALFGVASVLADRQFLEGLSGSIRLCAVPAEELVEIPFRESLLADGTIKYFGGKQEFLHRGYFDDCDLAFMIHTGGGKHRFGINAGSNGCIIKRATFKGKACHASAPVIGINALKAAYLAMNGIDAIRDTFPTFKFVRVHPILTEAGQAVNQIPGECVMENQVRGATPDICSKFNKRVNECVCSAAVTMGANVRIRDIPGYLPGKYDEKLVNIALEAMGEVVGPENAHYNTDITKWETGCTDMNDVSAVIPSVHCYGSGSVGAGHTAAYRIEDFDSALGDSAKTQLIWLRKLLENDAERARDVVANAQVMYPDKADYFKFLDSIFCDKEGVERKEGGTIVINP